MIAWVRVDIQWKMAIERSFRPLVPTSGAELTRQPLVKRGAALVESGEDDGGAVFAVFGFDRIECCDARGIPYLRMGEIDRDAFGILAIREPLDQIVAAAEEQRTVDAVANRQTILARRALGTNDMRHPAREQKHGQQYADGNAEGEIAGGNRDHDRQGHDQRFRD